MNTRWISRIEWIVAILLSLMIFALLGLRAVHAGALWRDECGTVQLALMPSIGDILKNFQHQTLPPLFPLVLRAYFKLFGTGDVSIHGFRLIAGATLIAAAWFNARFTGDRVPLLFPALFGLNSTFLYWGGYTIVAIPVVFALTLGASVLLRPTRARTIALVLVALASVHLLVNNLLLIGILALTAIAACLLCRSYKLALLFALVLVVCAISDFIYWNSYMSADWRVLLQDKITFAWLWPHIASTFGLPRSIMPWVWLLIFVATLVGAVWRLISGWRHGELARRRVLIFAILVALISPVVYCVSFQLAGIRTAESRHFLPMLAVLAANFDIIAAQLSGIAWARLARVLIAATALVFLPFNAWPLLTQRQTNIDLAAHELEQRAAPEDLIVINPWPLGISFNWYYHGPARWMTVPAISDHRIHRFDLLKEKMMQSAPIEDVEDTIRSTLSAGHRVWLVGTATPPRGGHAPSYLLAAPDPKYGWNYLAYRGSWSQQLGDFIARHAAHIELVMKPAPDVSPLENVPLWRIEGERY